MRSIVVGAIFGVIGGSTGASADTASQIEPKKIGSDAIVNQALKCRDSLKASQPDADPAVLLGACYCIVDYVRKESGDSNVKFWTFLEKLDKQRDSAKVARVISACNEWSVKNQYSSFVDTPYSAKLDVSTQQLYGATQGCQRNVKDLNLGTMQRVGVCACVADSMRTMPRKQLQKLFKTARQGGETASSFPQDKLEYCGRKWDVE